MGIFLQSQYIHSIHIEQIGLPDTFRDATATAQRFRSSMDDPPTTDPNTDDPPA